MPNYTHHGDMQIGGIMDFGVLGTYRLPNYATASEPDGTEGMLYFDTTLNVVKAYQSGSWVSITNTSGTLTLDSAYNNGNAIAVDGSALAITGSHSSNGAFTITHASAGSGDLIVLTGDNTGKLLNLVSTAAADAVLITADSATSHDVMKINADGLTTGSGLLVSSSGTLESAGTGLVAMTASGLTDGTVLILETVAATMSGGYYFRCYDGAANDFSIAEDGAVVIAGAAEGTAALTLTKGDIVVTDGDVALSGGELAVTDGVTTSGAGITLTTSATTGGDGLSVVANSLTTGSAIKVSSSGTVTSAGTGIVEIVTTGMTSGNALQIRVQEATLAGGKYIDLYDTTAGGSVFSIGEDGNQIIAGTAAGTDALSITAGDVTLSSGHVVLTSGNLTLDAGDMDITGNLTVTGDLVITGSVTYSTTAFSWTATAVTGDDFAFSAASTTGNAMVVTANSLTTGSGLIVTSSGTITSAGEGLVNIVGSGITTGDGLKIDLTEATLAGGNYINCYDDTATATVFKVGEDGITTITGAGGSAVLILTAGDVTISDGSVIITDADNANSLAITNDTITSGDLVDFNSTSISTGALMKLNANTAAHDGEVLEIISAGDATSTPVGISVVIASPTTGAARGIEVTMVGATTTAKGIAVTMDALTTGDMLYLDNGGGTLTAGSGFYINCNDDNVSDFTVGTDGATVITQAAVASTGLKIDGIWTSGYGIHIDNASGVVASGKALIFLDAGGASASGSNMLRLAPTGSAAAGSIGIEFVGNGKVMQAMYIDSDPTANSVVEIHGGGALGADKAVLEVVNDATTLNADASVVRFEQTHTGGVAHVMTLKQDDTSQGFTKYEGTEGSGLSVNSDDKSGGAALFLKIDINGVVHYIQATPGV